MLSNSDDPKKDEYPLNSLDALFDNNKKFFK